MGWPKSKKKIYVSSTVYNLAGDDVDNRPDFLKTTLVSAIMAERESIPEALMEALFSGSGIKFRRFMSWADRSNYSNQIGMSQSVSSTYSNLDEVIIAGQLPTSGGTIQIESSDLGSADYLHWVDQYVAINRPEHLYTAYEADMDYYSGGISITYTDSTTAFFYPSDFQLKDNYLYVAYREVAESIVESLITGTTVTLGSGEPFPDTTGWSNVSSTTQAKSENLDTTVLVEITYSDSTPPSSSSTTTTTTENYDETHTVWDKTESPLEDPINDSTYSLYSKMYQDQVGQVTVETTTTVVHEDIGGGVIKTTTTTTTEEVFTLVRTHRTDTQKTIIKAWGDVKIFIYRQNSGNAVLDALFSTTNTFGDFYPIIPFRVDNTSFPTHSPSLYSSVKKATKKAFNGKYDEILDKLNSNGSIGDIDYAYVVFGASLNTKDNSARKYIYSFFSEILDTFPPSSSSVLSDFRDEWDIAEASKQAWAIWRDSGNPDPLTEPLLYRHPTVPSYKLVTGTGNNPTLNYSVVLEWSFSWKETGTGLLKPNAKPDEYWFEIVSEGSFPKTIRIFGSNKVILTDVDKLVLNRQVTSNTWEKIHLVDIYFKNYIYGGNYDIISAREAMDDTSESGFIIPLHKQSYRAMGLMDGTQMACACCYMVLNSYQIVKQRYYQQSIFKVILVAIVIIVTVASGGLGANSAGLLGTNAAVGASIGFTAGTVAATIAGAVANAVAAAIVVSLITKAAIHVFGDKIGAIIGTVASIITLQVGTALNSGLSLSTAFTNLLSAQNILNLTNAVGQGYAGYLTADTINLNKQFDEFQKSANNELDKLNKKMKELMGNTNRLFDVTLVTNKDIGFNESLDSFLHRTLMVGSDVAEMSIDTLYDFTAITLSTSLPNQ